MNIISGNILSNISTDEAIIICHQVNCKGAMGAGLAKQIRSKWPSVYETYKRFCLKPLVQSSLLGNCQLVNAEGSVWVANLFGQDGFGTDKVQTDYTALKSALLVLYGEIYKKNLTAATIRIPYNMGCGLAGGNWDVVEKIIKDVFDDSSVNVEIWKI